jgi:ABC-type nitrate/sulfonate/bicarbonate transport system permease component
LVIFFPIGLIWFGFGGQTIALIFLLAIAIQSQSSINVRDVMFSLHRSIDPDAGLLHHSLLSWVYSSRLG